MELCQYYLDRPNERQRLIVNSQSYYDQYLHPQQLARYYLAEILRAVARLKYAVHTK